MATLYIVYNANGSMLGKLEYGYRKLTWDKKQQDTPCAACDMTHGGLSLNPTQAWLDVKQQIELSPAGIKVKELHRDELPQEVSEYIKANKIALPVAIMKSKDEFTVVLDKPGFNHCQGDASKFLEQLKASEFFPLQ